MSRWSWRNTDAPVTGPPGPHGALVPHRLASRRKTRSRTRRRRGDTRSAPAAGRTVRTSDPELTGLPRQALFEIGRDLGIDLRDLIVMRSDQLIGAIREVGTPRPSGADPST